MLKILAVDDEPICLKSLEREILKAEPDAQVTCCLSAASACEQLKLSGADVAFVESSFLMRTASSSRSACIR